MTVFLTNSLTRKKEEFKPIDPNHVKMYVCGPTVYDRPHLGNARSAVVYDVLFRVLKEYYPKVTYVRNITDVDDKIIAASNETGLSVHEITKKFEAYYNEDIGALNCLPPTHTPRATENIAQMIFMIQELIKKDFAYVAEGHVLFRVSKFEEYGKLSGRSVEDMIAGARVEVAPYKEYPGDFVLWKPSKQGEDSVSYLSPWGKGRPGWHIECSAMSKRYLGENFDIHGGGADLTFPHHENEVAQSECANGKKFANYWVHNGFLMVNGEKMSKSLGNFKTVRELINEGIEGVVIRYLYLTTHYKKPLDFTDKLVSDSQKAVNKFRELLRGVSVAKRNEEIILALRDDLNTPLVLSIMHQLASEGRLEELKFACDFMGLNLEAAELEIPNEVNELIQQREEFKNIKDWQNADKIRDQIIARGFEIKDSKEGIKISKITRQKERTM